MHVQYVYAGKTIVENDHAEAQVPSHEDKVVKNGYIYRVVDVVWHPLENRAVVNLTLVTSLW